MVKLSIRIHRSEVKKNVGGVVSLVRSLDTGQPTHLTVREQGT